MTIRLYDLVGSDPSRPFSPHCWKVRMALAHKGLGFEAVPVRFTEVAGVEGGGGRTVPVIRDGDTVVQDSFAIAEYLDDAYLDRPPLFEGASGRALARFVESWSQRTLHPAIVKATILEIHAFQDEENRAFFRASRERTFGKPLEEVQDGRTEEKRAATSKALEPLRATLRRQPFLAGDGPMFADYIVFGAFQWMRCVSTFSFLEGDDPIQDWLDRCLDLHGGIGRALPAAA
ncbi:glutathione S-transferase family protein [Aureimonas flava]|uniref:Glutathione S-transferase family protein n=1 Tax=Aureimonas flava TaxID=2320271 RepID=A0A3A1WQ71_9HYPH|nr:glutathione S-transferase family protein [Aureimonas flava]RIY03540.1 glutathione S-transferase family protein [Aureimonas flava]